MNFFITERQVTDENKKNAANKARADVETILRQQGWQEIPIDIPLKEKNSLLSSAKQNVDYYKIWKDKLSRLKKGDRVLIQFPPRAHSVFYPRLLRHLRKRGVTSAFLIHDLEKLRYINDRDISTKKRIRMKLEETTLLRAADYVIAHNPVMRDYLTSEGVLKERIICLSLFDYVMQDYTISPKHFSNQVIIAGSLSPKKVGYLSALNTIPDVEFNLYGVGFDEKYGGKNIHYQGSFMPDDLPHHLQGSFGLVWDGTSAKSCAGMYGEYLRYNNPHKTSLYLACGFPVIVWKESAVADFVQKHQVGIAVSSLFDIAGALKEISPEEYGKMCENVRKIAQKAQRGGFLSAALQKMA
jgi:hypothetical protein